MFTGQADARSVVDGARIHSLRRVAPWIFLVQHFGQTRRGSWALERLRDRVCQTPKATYDDAVRVARCFAWLRGRATRPVTSGPVRLTEGVSPALLLVTATTVAVVVVSLTDVGGGGGASVAFGVLAAVFPTAVAAGHAGRAYGHNQALWRCAQWAALSAKDDAEQRAAFASRRMAIDLPAKPMGEGYVYVIRFDTGVVKVGQTLNPGNRLPDHRADAAAFGVTVTDFWISPSHINFRDNETRLINACVQVSRRSRVEYFHNLAFDQAVGFATELTFHSSRPSESTGGTWR